MGTGQNVQGNKARGGAKGKKVKARAINKANVGARGVGMGRRRQATMAM